MPERYVGVSNMTELEWVRHQNDELRWVLKRIRRRLDKAGISFSAVLHSAAGSGAIQPKRLAQILDEVESIREVC